MDHVNMLLGFLFLFSLGQRGLAAEDVMLSETSLSAQESSLNENLTDVSSDRLNDFTDETPNEMPNEIFGVYENKGAELGAPLPSKPDHGNSVANHPLEKTRVDQYLTEACRKIEANLKSLEQDKITKATQYFTPMFASGKDGRLQTSDRSACINVEGSCIVDDYLYNWSADKNPWGQFYRRSEVPFIFGKGNGESTFNTTDALDPCRTLAADDKIYPIGTIIYIPSMKDKICPQSGKTIDGCFVVGDIGGAIRGKGRFDMFTGECANYNKSNNSCGDHFINSFVAEKGAPFFVVERNTVLAQELRQQADLLINYHWRVDGRHSLRKLAHKRR